MQQRRWFSTLGVVALALVLSVQGTPADIQNPVWESPVEGPAGVFGGNAVSGIQTFRGHVSSTTGAQVTVRLLIPALGITVQIPWGSDRADVAASGPDRLSGFGDALNIGNLPPGPVAMTLEMREGGGTGACNAPTCVSLTRNFTVVKPGARATEIGPFRFLNGFSLFATLPIPSTSGTVIPSNVGLDLSTAQFVGGPDIIVAPVTLLDSDAAGTLRTATARLRWVANTQSFGIVNSATSDNSFTAVQTILGQKCGVPGCHVGGGNTLPGSMVLNDTSNSFFNTVARASVENAQMLRITPNNTDNSYLFQKIIANGNIAAGTARMPLGCSGATCLSDAEIATIQNWINAGAPPPAP